MGPERRRRLALPSRLLPIGAPGVSAELRAGDGRARVCLCVQHSFQQIAAGQREHLPPNPGPCVSGASGRTFTTWLVLSSVRGEKAWATVEVRLWTTPHCFEARRES